VKNDVIIQSSSGDFWKLVILAKFESLLIVVVTNRSAEFAYSLTVLLCSQKSEINMSDSQKFPIDLSVVAKMVYEENRLKSFTEKGQWPFADDCNCTPEKMAESGFYWCGTDNQPDLVRCFVCMQDFEDWEPADIPRYH